MASSQAEGRSWKDYTYICGVKNNENKIIQMIYTKANW